MGLGSSLQSTLGRDGGALLRFQVSRILGEVSLTEDSAMSVDGYNSACHDLLTAQSVPPEAPPPLPAVTAPAAAAGAVECDAKTHNLRKLALHSCWLLDRASGASDDSDLVQELLSSLSLLRTVAVMVVEAGGLPSRHLDNPPTVAVSGAAPSTGPVVCPRLARALAAYLVSRDPATLTGTLQTQAHAEAAFCLVALLSTQLSGATSKPTDGQALDEESQIVLGALTGTGDPLPQRLVHRLVSTFVYLDDERGASPSPQIPSPAPAVSVSVAAAASAMAAAPPQHQQQSALLSSIAAIFSPILNAFSLINSWVFGRDAGAAATAAGATQQRFRKQQLQDARAALREAELFLLLVLVHPSHLMEPDSRNAFRDALNALSDSHYGTPDGVQPASSVDFTKLYDGLTRGGEIRDLTALLLYFLLQGNNNFTHYALARPDCESLLLPLLKLMYESVEEVDQGWGHQQSIYVLVIILLILTKDVSFSKNLHSVRARGLSWYKEHYLTETTLGGLLVLIIVRVVQVNLRKLRDPYLHTNCLAILANCAPYFVELPSFPALRLVKLVELILVKCAPLMAETGEGTAASAGTATKEDEEATTYTGFLQAILRIIVNALAFGMDRNPHLVYALLQQKATFSSLVEQKSFAELAQPVLQVVEFFEKEVSVIPEDKRTLERIVEVITSRSAACKGQLRLVAEHVAYRYEEEPTAFEFFNPLVWSLIFSSELLRYGPTALRSSSTVDTPVIPPELV